MLDHSPKRCKAAPYLKSEAQAKDLSTLWI